MNYEDISSEVTFNERYLRWQLVITLGPHSSAFLLDDSAYDLEYGEVIPQVQDTLELNFFANLQAFLAQQKLEESAVLSSPQEQTEGHTLGQELPATSQT